MVLHPLDDMLVSAPVAWSVDVGGVRQASLKQHSADVGGAVVCWVNVHELFVVIVVYSCPVHE